MTEFYIQKQPKEKDAVRISKAEDIPTKLAKTIKFKGDHLEMENAEGIAKCPLGMVIGFEKSEKTKSKFGAWPIEDESRILEMNGKIYARPVPTLAAVIGDDVPEMLNGADITKNADGSFSIRTKWGVSTGFPGEALWVKYGEENGILDANILTITEPSFAQYNICTPDGQNICPLTEIWSYFEEQSRLINAARL